MFAVRNTGEPKLFAPAGETTTSTSSASGSVTRSVTVAFCLSEFLRIHSVNRPATMTASLFGLSAIVVELGVPPSTTGGSMGSKLTAEPPATWVVVVSTLGATGLREQLVSVTARAAIIIALSRELCRTVGLVGLGCRVVVPRYQGPSPFT